MRRPPSVPTRLALALALLLPLLFGIAVSPPNASAQEALAKVSAVPGSFYYLPGEHLFLKVDLQIPSDMLPGEFSLQLNLFSPAITRSYLASFRCGDSMYPVRRRNLATLSPETEESSMAFELDPASLGITQGVYPFEIKLLREEEEVGKDRNFLVVMKPETGYPLNLCLLWTLDFLPSSDARGNYLDGGLASACSPSEPGFLHSLVDILNKRPGMPSTLVLPVFTYQDLVMISSDATTVSEDTKRGAREVLAGLGKLLSEGRVDLLGTSYSFCDLATFESPGWEEELDAQIRMGLEGGGAAKPAGKGFVTPSFRLTDQTMHKLVEAGVDYTVISQEVLQQSAAGRELLRGTTVSQPVRLVDSRGSLLKGFVLDQPLYAYLEESATGDPGHLIQNLMAELAVLQKEKPYAIRSCVLAFPPGFLPGREVLESLYDAVQSCPWLQVRRLDELSRDQFPLEGVAVQVPMNMGEPSDYPAELAPLRDQALSFSAAVVPEDHPLPQELDRLVLVGMNHRFSEDTDQNATLNFLNSLREYLSGWISKVSIGRKRSVTLSGTTGNLSVDILSELDFPLRATLRMENPNINFPEGNILDVQVEPRENRFLLPIRSNRRGSFLVEIELETNGLVLDRTTITVNTSIINTLAIILLACLLGVVGVASLIRRAWRAIPQGKHVRKGNGD